MGWTRRLHCTCDGCGRMWLDGALTKDDAEQLATDGGWTAAPDEHGLTRHRCSSCQQPPQEQAAA